MVGEFLCSCQRTKMIPDRESNFKSRISHAMICPPAGASRDSENNHIPFAHISLVPV